MYMKLSLQKGYDNREMDECNHSVSINVYLQTLACGHNGQPQVLLPDFYIVLFWWQF